MLPASFFSRPTLTVTRQLLGQRLVRVEADGRRISGRIVEAEAYIGENDLACHCRSGRTPRTQVMFGPPGFAFVYLTYGMHWMFNCVTEESGLPAAVLIRAIKADEGLEQIESRRGQQPRKRWTDGPGKICQALNIFKDHNGLDLSKPGSEIFIEADQPFPDSSVTMTPRVGLNTVPEPWFSKPWRYAVEGNG
jgi:DNA-3-methyladenine glycosylase